MAMNQNKPTIEVTNRPTGMWGFTIIWIGQVVSLFGTAMTNFALTIWAWQITGQATALALVGFFAFAPALLITPFAGALVDRWSRKFVMMLSDLSCEFILAYSHKSSFKTSFTLHLTFNTLG